MAQAKKESPGSISLEEFTSSVYASVLTAIERRGEEGIKGPILFGFIWWPEGRPGEFFPPGTPESR